MDAATEGANCLVRGCTHTQRPLPCLRHTNLAQLGARSPPPLEVVLHGAVVIWQVCIPPQDPLTLTCCNYAAPQLHVICQCNGCKQARVLLVPAEPHSKFALKPGKHTQAHHVGPVPLFDCPRTADVSDPCNFHLQETTSVICAIDFARLVSTDPALSHGCSIV